MDPARLQLVFTAILLSTGGAAIKLCSLSGWQIASFRCGVAVLTLLAFPAARRRLRPGSLVFALSYAATLILFVQANKHTTAANSTFLQSTAPLFIVLLGPWLLRERIQRSDLGFLAILVAGLVLVAIGAPQQLSAPDPFAGNAMALTSGLTWAVALVSLRGLDAAGKLPAVVLGNALAFAACLPAALPVASISAVDAGAVLFLGAVQIGFAFVLMTAALRRVPAFDASLILLLEPALNPLWAWWMHGEHPGWLALAGGAVIAGTTFVRGARAAVNAAAQRIPNDAA